MTGTGGPRVLVHAGFHKTGTTSLQNFLHRNRKALGPHFAYYGKADFLQAGANARIYGQKPFPWRMAAFRRSLRRFLATVPDGRDIVLSRETFSGGMPGHRTWRGALMTAYAPAARPLARAILAEVTRRFPDAEISFLYTTRARDPWLASVHGHLLRSIKLTQDLDTFLAAQSATPGPEAEAATLAADLDVPVHIARLEDLGSHPFGPAKAVLDIMGVPGGVRRNLSPAFRANTGQAADLKSTFLALNRGGLTGAALKHAKEAAIAEASQ